MTYPLKEMLALEKVHLGWVNHAGMMVLSAANPYKEQIARQRQVGFPTHPNGQPADHLADNTRTHSCPPAPAPPLILTFSPSAKIAAEAKESSVRQRVD